MIYRSDLHSTSSDAYTEYSLFTHIIITVSQILYEIKIKYRLLSKMSRDMSIRLIRKLRIFIVGTITRTRV